MFRISILNKKLILIGTFGSIFLAMLYDYKFNNISFNSYTGNIKIDLGEYYLKKNKAPVTNQKALSNWLTIEKLIFSKYGSDGLRIHNINNSSKQISIYYNSDKYDEIKIVLTNIFQIIYNSGCSNCQLPVVIQNVVIVNNKNTLNIYFMLSIGVFTLLFLSILNIMYGQCTKYFEI